MKSAERPERRLPSAPLDSPRRTNISILKDGLHELKLRPLILVQPAANTLIHNQYRPVTNLFIY